jgi:hypothetical protein
MLGSTEKVKWTAGTERLVIHRPARRPGEYAVVFEVA